MEGHVYMDTEASSDSYTQDLDGNPNYIPNEAFTYVVGNNYN